MRGKGAASVIPRSAAPTLRRVRTEGVGLVADTRGACGIRQQQTRLSAPSSVEVATLVLWEAGKPVSADRIILDVLPIVVLRLPGHEHDAQLGHIAPISFPFNASSPLNAWCGASSQYATADLVDRSELCRIEICRACLASAPATETTVDRPPV